MNVGSREQQLLSKNDTMCMAVEGYLLRHKVLVVSGMVFQPNSNFLQKKKRVLRWWYCDVQIIPDESSMVHSPMEGIDVPTARDNSYTGCRRAGKCHQYDGGWQTHEKNMQLFKTSYIKRCFKCELVCDEYLCFNHDN